LCCFFSGCGGTPAPPEVQDGLRIEFKGADAFSEGELRAVIQRDVERYLRDPRPSVLDDAAFRLTHHYRLAGYAQARVQVRESAGRILFRLREGSQYRLGRVHFRGNHTFSDEELEAALPGGLLGGAPVYSPQAVDLLVAEVLSAYGKKGHVDARIEEPAASFDAEEGKVHLTLRIHEGPRYRFGGVEGLGEHPDLAEKLEPLFQKHYRAGLEREVEAALLEHLRESGRPFARVEAVPRVERDEARVVLSVEVRPGPEARLSEVRVSGQERTREAFILRRAGLEKGHLVRASDLRRAEERLRVTGLFRSVRVSPGEFRQDPPDPAGGEKGTLPVDVVVEEKSPGEVAVRAGYGSLEGPRVGADVAYENLFGGGELARLSGTVSRLGVRGDAETAVPYFLGTDFRPGVSGFYENREYPSFEASSFGGVVSLSYPVWDTMELTVGSRYSEVRTVEVDEDVPPGDLLDFDYLALFLSWRWDRRDSALFPTRGWLLRGLVEWSDESFRSDIPFLRGEGRVTGYLPLPWGLVLAASAQGGVIAPIDDTEVIPISLRYFAGGTGTVRGFEPDTIGPQADGEPLGGEVFLAGQLEVRFPIWADFHGAVFTDRGGVWFDRRDVDLDETRYSVGLGARYYTPAGALAADVAWNPSREEGERAVELHLSIGFPF
jgi:outer membrane protein insertion porin family